MRPAISGRITTDSLDSSDPTAVTVRSTIPTRTGTASTGIGGAPPGGFAPPEAPPEAPPGAGAPPDTAPVTIVVSPATVPPCFTKYQ
ncbi:hypothetical protein GCM10007856_45880 [Azospirillum oryzae]|nr:hypothetical protein GCM10007856_45880 [Azospirillum oryzae]